MEILGPRWRFWVLLEILSLVGDFGYFHQTMIFFLSFGHCCRTSSKQLTLKQKTSHSCNDSLGMDIGQWPLDMRQITDHISSPPYDLQWNVFALVGTSTFSSSWAASPRKGSSQSWPSGARAPVCTRSALSFLWLALISLFFRGGLLKNHHLMNVA